MLKFWEEFQGKSWTGEEVLMKEDLGMTAPLVDIKKALGKFDWSDI
jgi:hypothetical protein